MILNLNKPIGWTSFDVVKKIRGIVKEKKVGHGGTLDPFAEGVLILGTSKDTKNLTAITQMDKEYETVIKIGETTGTLDTESEVTLRKNIPILNRTLIKDILESFLGKTLQTPPMFSAKKVNGKRLYTLARKNIVIERDPVEINIKKISLLSFTKDSISISVTCSKGTYIRVLGKDIAERLNTVGYLTSLTRTRVGSYLIKDSLSIEQLEDKWKSLLV
ncbi:MAG: tRNA pseudouridine(55) synthase TruB [Fidelibacterota bacterium]|jgi:tRNA pseudouridine55 synthase|tara:strand:+ start:476 stop:1129 length:654 start_codon:yes stop_codon:yes gene_type:complete